MRLLGVLALTLWFTPAAQPATVYYSDQPTSAAGSIMAVGLDGTSQRVLYTGTSSGNFRGIAWHRASQRVFFLDQGAAKAIFAMSPLGSNVQQVVTISTNLNSDLEVDETNGYLYWAESGSTAGYIQRCALDGTGVTAVVTTAPGSYAAPYFLFLDVPRGYLYWGVASESSNPSSFFRASLAGLIDSTWSITTATRTRDLGLDPATDTMYWCDRQMGTIYKRSMTGGVNQAVLSGMNAPHGLALDVVARKLYWADTGGRGSGAGISTRRVARCNFDGTEFENLTTPSASPASEVWDVALDLACPTYADWRSRFFSTSSANAGPTDDADGDGASNLLEYALVTQPRQATSVPRIAAQGTSLQYARRRDANLNYRVEVSNDLVTWHDNQDGSGLTWTTETQSTAVDADFESVTVAPGPALGTASAFFRLRVNAP